MATGSVFENNRTQAVRIPAEMRFAAGIRKVTVRAVGPDRVLSPIGPVDLRHQPPAARGARHVQRSCGSDLHQRDHPRRTVAWRGEERRPVQDAAAGGGLHVTALSSASGAPL